MSTLDNGTLLQTLNRTSSIHWDAPPSNVTRVVFEFSPIRDPLTTVIPMTLVYALILVTGVFGNFCTCIVIARNKYMHTATNYYLFSLAVSDQMLLVLGLPQEIYQLWIKSPYAFGESFCVLRGLTSETSTNASILTITAFTVERYVAICHPLRAHTMSHLPRAIRTILAVWMVAALCSIPLALQFGIVYVKGPDGHDLWETAECSVKRPLPHAFELSTFLFFVLPISLISVLYVLIGIKLRQSAMGRRNTSPEHDACSRQNLASRRAVIKMLVAVVVSFFICWTPFHAQRLLAIYTSNSSALAEMTFLILTYVSGVTYYLSATVNPILYQVFSLKYRQAFKDTFGMCYRRNRSKASTADTTFSVFANHHSDSTRVSTPRRVSLSCHHLPEATDTNHLSPNNSNGRMVSLSYTDVSRRTGNSPQHSLCPP